MFTSAFAEGRPVTGSSTREGVERDVLQSIRVILPSVRVILPSIRVIPVAEFDRFDSSETVRPMHTIVYSRSTTAISVSVVTPNVCQEPLPMVTELNAGVRSSSLDSPSD